MKWKLRFAVEARTDLKAISDYSQAEAGPRIAARYMRDVRRRLTRLRNMPKTGVAVPELGPGIRFIPCRSHVIYYELDQDDVVILRVLHASQDRNSITRKK